MRAHVCPSMRTELPHNVIVVISVNSGAVLYASCEPCHASSLGRCSHVVTFHFNEIAFLQIQITHCIFLFPSAEHLMNLLYLLCIKNDGATCLQDKL